MRSPTLFTRESMCAGQGPDINCGKGFVRELAGLAGTVVSGAPWLVAKRLTVKFLLDGLFSG